MDALLKADIIFFVSTIESIAITFFALGALVVLFYVVRIARELSFVLVSLKEGVYDSRAYVAELTERMNTNLFFKLFFPARKKVRGD